MRKTCKRKHYVPVNPITYAISGAAISHGKDVEMARGRELSAIEAFQRGRATLQEWRDLDAMLSLSEMLARMKVGREEMMPACADAEAVLIAAALRFEATGRMEMDAAGVHAMRELWQYHDLQRGSVARSVYEAAIKKAADRTRSKAPGVIEL